MEKTYKYNSGKKLQQLFKEYNRDNFSIYGYRFISNYIQKTHRVSKFDVIQLCEMFEEKTYKELFNENRKDYTRKNGLRKKLKKENSNLHIKELENDNFIIWHDEHIKELENMARY